MDSAMKIVVVEDHDDLREVTVAALSDMGHDVRGVDCAEALDDELARFQPDILILDLNLPGEDGLSLARRLRAVAHNIGIIMVTARNQPHDVARGYTSGADIYVTKPASPDELQAAILALARRLQPRTQENDRLVLNPKTLQLRGHHGDADLSNQEYLLLASLAKAKDQRLETWQLLELSDKPVDEPEKKALAVQIVRLRKKLIEAGAAEPTIKAIRGTGYQLCVAVSIEA
jgi:DNA-binding response OmpR family regulator